MLPSQCIGMEIPFAHLAKIPIRIFLPFEQSDETERRLGRLQNCDLFATMRAGEATWSVKHLFETGGAWFGRCFVSLFFFRKTV